MLVMHAVIIGQNVVVNSKHHLQFEGLHIPKLMILDYSKRTMRQGVFLLHGTTHAVKNPVGLSQHQQGQHLCRLLRF